MGYGHKPSKLGSPSLVVSPLPHEYVLPENLPTSFDWRWTNNTVFTTKIGNQLQPKFCGSCWAFASTSALADRIKIQTKAQTSDIILSVQALLDCGNNYGTGGCGGGDAGLANKFFHDYGITDDTCAPYMAVDYWMESELPCEETMCRQCDRYGTCSAVPNATRYYASEFGVLPTLNVTAMMAEIWMRGPIVCSMYAHSQSFEDYTGGIITDPKVYPYQTHDISIVGWGETTEGLKYWIVRNSFGTQWGEIGWFQIERGTNCLLIEESCWWAVPNVDSGFRG